MLPVYVPKSLFSPSVYELSHTASYEDGVKSHKLGGGVCGIWSESRFVPLLLLIQETESGETWLRKE